MLAQWPLQKVHCYSRSNSRDRAVRAEEGDLGRLDIGEPQAHQKHSIWYLPRRLQGSSDPLAK